MNRICYLVFPFLFLCNFLFAQTGAIKKELETFESSNDHEAAVIGLSKLLASEKLSPEDKLAVQSKLISQYQQLQKWDTCLSYCQAQVALAHQQNNPLAEATFYKLIANTYYHIPDKEKAVAYWEKCIAISEQNNYSVLLEQCYHNIGAVNLENNTNLDIAEQYFLKSLKLGLVNNKENSSDNNRHYRLLATLYTQTNQLQKAE
ncbi:MAG: tetratricopeptide repeat protein, partial [Ferruginibacter sp.]